MHLEPRRHPVFFLAVAVAALVAVAPAASPAFAQTPLAAPPTLHHPMAQAALAAPEILHHPFDELRQCLRILDLSDAQKADIKAIFEAAKPQIEAFVVKLKADRDALKADLAKTPPDPCSVGNDFLQLHTDREAARAFLESVRDQLLALLTPEQKAKLAGCLQAPRHAATLPSEEPDPVE